MPAPHPRPLRRVAAAVLVLVGAIAPVACSNSSKDDGAASGDDRPATSTTTSSPPSTLADEDFGDTVDEFSASVDAAGTDFCALMEAFTAGPTVEPSSPEQVKSIVEGTSQLFEALSQSGGVDAETAATLQEMAQLLSDEAAAADYSPSVLSAQGEDSPLQDPAFGAALGQLVARATAECEPPSDGAGG